MPDWFGQVYILCAMLESGATYRELDGVGFCKHCNISKKNKMKSCLYNIFAIL